MSPSLVFIWYKDPLGVSRVNKSKIFRIIRKTPIVTKQNMNTARPKINLKVPSPIFLLFNYYII